MHSCKQMNNGTNSPHEISFEKIHLKLYTLFVEAVNSPEWTQLSLSLPLHWTKSKHSFCLSWKYIHSKVTAFSIHLSVCVSIHPTKQSNTSMAPSRRHPSLGDDEDVIKGSHLTRGANPCVSVCRPRDARLSAHNSLTRRVLSARAHYVCSARPEGPKGAEKCRWSFAYA